VISRVAWSETTYNAASVQLSNGAETQECPACLDGKRIGRIGGDDDGTATFTNIVAPIDGLYPMTVYFMTSDDRSLDIAVNHETISSTVIFRHNSRRDEVSNQTILVPLLAGANSIVFDNPREYGPELEQISVASAPVESRMISGVLQDGDGAPMANVRVSLSGSFERRTTTDARGRYEFKFLPDGVYHVAPDKAGRIFAPNGQFFPALITNETEGDFVARAFPSALPSPAVLESGRWRMVYDLANGVVNILFDGKLLLGNVHAAAQLPRTVTSMDYLRRSMVKRRVKDRFGSGVEVQVESANSETDKMVQTFWFYDDADYFLTQVKIIRKQGAASNFITPLVSREPVRLFPPGDNRALFVPFDNDKWIRYNAVPFGGELTSYEVSAFYNNASRQGLVVGSIDHDTWKTGVRSTTTGGDLNDLEVFGGIASATTRDTLPHGKVTGATIQSPRVFVGFFSDWRAGLEAFAKANATIAPLRPWKGGVPFGWNSWGKLQFNISFAKAIEVSDFFANELQPHHFEDNRLVYIGLDSGWNKFTDDELKRFVDNCKRNHQEAGIYFAPFTDFQRRDYAMVEGSHYRYKDIYLYAHGQKQRIDGGVALDPTHPGTRARIEHTIKRFKKLGFKYLKADFMVHGSLEGDHFHDPQVTTGLQAYNAGMKFLEQTMGRNMYLNIAISPLFPSQYADSRRIACDAWGDIDKTEYTLNALTYGWWLGSVYDYNDPDHVVLGGFGDGENRARVTSAILTGLFVSGDDFSKAGDPAGKEKARKFLTNADIDALGRIRKSFRPVEGNTANHAANMFVYEDRKCFYLAAFNYSQTETNMEVSFERIGLKTSRTIYAKELWSGQIGRASSPMTFRVSPADAVVYQFYKGGQRPN